MWKASTVRLSAALTKGKGKSPFSVTKRKCTGGKESSQVGCKPPSPPPKPPLPPPPPGKKGKSFLGVVFKLLGVATVGAGGVVGYAWFDPTFRKTVEDYVPYSKEAMAAIFSGLQLSPIKESNEKKPVDDQPLSFSPPTTKAPATPVKIPVKSTDVQQKSEAVTSKDDGKLQAQRVKEEQRRLAEKRLKEKEAEEAAENAALEVILENLIKRAGEAAEAAVAVQQKFAEATRKHTQLLKKAMEDTTEILEKDHQWQEVRDAFREREALSKDITRIVDEAKSNIDKLKKCVEDGKQNIVTKKNKILQSAQETYNKVNNSMRTVTAEVMKSESDARVMAKYKDLIDRGRKQFAEELESIMPDVKLGNRDMRQSFQTEVSGWIARLKGIEAAMEAKKLTEEELNALIAHAHRRIEQLQRQLAEQMALESQRLEKALQQRMKEDENLTAAKVAAEMERLKEEFLLEKEKWDAEAHIEFEKELRQQLARQAAAHSDHLQDVLKVQAHELERQCEREVHTQLLKERQSFQTEVSGWIARLKGIEAAVEARAESEKIARVAQDLWLSCIALNGVIRHGNEAGQNWEEKLKPLKKEVEAISDAGGKHPFVETLLMSIPEDALERGIWTEVSLRERFPHVNTVCRRVAMVDETGNPLFKYFLSYVQSFFIVNSLYAKSEDDFIDLNQLDTFSILGHAEYWLERGDLEQAVRFMNQLTGAPRRVASDWVKEAKLLLETRQAAYALTAFASASGLGTIF